MERAIAREEGAMPRRASGVPRKRPPRPLTITENLPEDDRQLYDHCNAGWTAAKEDTQHFPSLPNVAAMDQGLKNLRSTLDAAPNGGTVEKEAVKTAATVVRSLWGQFAAYAETALRSLPVEATPPILASVMLYKSNRGRHKPKPPLAAKHGATSGTAIVTALAILRALTYTFEWSSDQVNWSAQTTGKAKIALSGLTPGKTYWFRVRAFLRDGTTTDYVPAVSLIVI
jgi:hypothetical protein